MFVKWQRAYLDTIRFEHPFHHVSVTPQHTSMMDSEPVVEQLFHLLVTGCADFSPEEIELRM